LERTTAAAEVGVGEMAKTMCFPYQKWWEKHEKPLIL